MTCFPFIAILPVPEVHCLGDALLVPLRASCHMLPHSCRLGSDMVGRCDAHSTHVHDMRLRCGKYYDPSKMPQDQAPPPGGTFPIPTSSQNPLLAFRCTPAIKPYLAEDASSSAAVLIDSPVVYSNIQGAEGITLPSGSLSNAGSLSVSVSVGGKVLAHGTVPLNATAYELSLSLGDLTPQVAPYNLSCQATYSGGSSSQVYTTSSALYFLPDPSSGAVTKMDLRTGALLAKPANGQGSYQPVFPIGFYTEFEYLAGNLSLIDELGSQG